MRQGGRGRPLSEEMELRCVGGKEASMEMSGGRGFPGRSRASTKALRQEVPGKSEEQRGGQWVGAQRVGVSGGKQEQICLESRWEGGRRA